MSRDLSEHLAVELVLQKRMSEAGAQEPLHCHCVVVKAHGVNGRVHEELDTLEEARGRLFEGVGGEGGEGGVQGISCALQDGVLP